MVVGYGAAAIMAALVALPLAWHLFGGAARALFSSDAGGAELWDAGVLFAITAVHLALAGALARRERRAGRRPDRRRHDHRTELTEAPAT